MKTLSYKHKTWLLYILLILLVYLLHQKVFSGTVALINNTSEFAQKMELSGSNSFSSTAELKAELEQYNTVSVISSDTANPANEVLNFVSAKAEAHQVTIESFEPATTFELNNYQINNFPVRLSGDFISLLTVIDLMETKLQIARIASLRFYTVEKNNANETKLYAELSLQYITKK